MAKLTATRSILTTSSTFPPDEEKSKTPICLFMERLGSKIQGLLRGKKYQPLDISPETEEEKTILGEGRCPSEGKYSTIAQEKTDITDWACPTCSRSVWLMSLEKMYRPLLMRSWYSHLCRGLCHQRKHHRGPQKILLGKEAL